MRFANLEGLTPLTDCADIRVEMGTVLILSGGGVKSAVAAARFVRDHELILLHIDHGQPGAQGELKALAMLASQWPTARLCSCTTPPIKLVSSAVRAGVGTVSSPDPKRNSLEQMGNQPAQRLLLPTMLSVAAQGALRFGAGAIVVGCSSHANGEHIGLPGPESGPDALRQALHSFEIFLETMLRPKTRITLELPLIDLPYSQILKLGQRMGVPWQRTHTCEAPAAGPCGKCPSCRQRALAFQEAGLTDPATPAVVTTSSQLTPGLAGSGA